MTMSDAYTLIERAIQSLETLLVTFVILSDVYARKVVLDKGLEKSGNIFL